VNQNTKKTLQKLLPNIAESRFGNRKIPVEAGWEQGERSRESQYCLVSVEKFMVKRNYEL
jgi:hypothetical protein